VTRDLLVSRFGPRVADIVQDCSDTPPDYRGGQKAPWLERKQAYLEKLSREKYPLCRVALADKLHNLRALVQDYRRIGAALWARFKAGPAEQLWYQRALVKALTEAGAPAHLLHELESLVSELEDRAPHTGER
jgi:(p)ppGpp synthase/HD superfamily hydrolase